MDSSELTKIRKNRLLYSNYIAQEIKFNGGCALRIQLGPGNDNTAASLINIKEGELFTTKAEQTTILTLNACPFRIIQLTGGSMRFTAGATPTNLSFVNDASLRPGTGAFTIEWFQFYQDSDANAIVFSIGTFPSNDLCIVYTNQTLFLFSDGSSSSVSSAVTKNIWQHIAVVGNGGADGSRNIKVYVDGILVLTRTANYNINQTEVLRIGNQSDSSVPNGNFAGLITNFRWVVGTAIYTSDFIKPTAPLSVIPGTQLLLSVTTSSTVIRDSSSADRIATNSGVIYDSLSPFS
jgi:hypothetical protein